MESPSTIEKLLKLRQEERERCEALETLFKLAKTTPYSVQQLLELTTDIVHLSIEHDTDLNAMLDVTSGLRGKTIGINYENHLVNVFFKEQS